MVSKFRLASCQVNDNNRAVSCNELLQLTKAVMKRTTNPILRGQQGKKQPRIHPSPICPFPCLSPPTNLPTARRASCYICLAALIGIGQESRRRLFFPQLFLRLILTVLADRKFTVKGTVDEMRVAVCFNLITLCQMKYLFLPCQPQHCLSYLNRGGGPRLEPSISHIR